MRLKVSNKHKYRRKVVKWFIPTDNLHKHLSNLRSSRHISLLSKHEPHFHLRALRRTMGSFPFSEAKESLKKTFNLEEYNGN